MAEQARTRVCSAASQPRTSWYHRLSPINTKAYNCFMKRFEVVNEKLTVAMNKVAEFVGRPVAFLAMIVIIAVWFIASNFLPYDVWFDIMDVTIFITTFFLLFVLQASQNADTEAIQDKLDEIIDALPRAQTSKKGEVKRLKRGKAKR